MSTISLLRYSIATYSSSQAILYRLMAGLGVVLALVMVLATPHHPRDLRMPDPWTYIFAFENFAQGKWVITEDELAAGRMEFRLQGGHFIMYVPLAPDR